MTQKLPDHFPEQFTELLYDAYNKLRFNRWHTGNLSDKEAQICSLFEKTLKIPLQESEKKQIHELASRNYTVTGRSPTEDFTEILKTLEILSLFLPKENQEEWCEQLGQLLYDCNPVLRSEKELSPFCQRVLYHMVLTQAVTNGSEISEFIQNYGITDQKALIEIAKIAAAQEQSNIPEFIQKYGITDQKALIEIAKISATTPDSHLSENIQNYGIQDEKVLIEIAKIAATTPDSHLSRYIQNYGIQDEKALIEIAKIAATTPYSNLSRCIQKYGIQDEKALIEIAKIAATTPDSRLSENIQNYKISNQQVLFDIITFALEYFPKLSILNKLIQHTNSPLKDPISVLFSLQTDLDQTKLAPLVEAISQEADRSLGEHLTLWLCLFLAKCIQEKLPLETVNLLLDKGFIQAIFEYRDSSMRFKLLKDVFLFAKNEKALEWKSPGKTPRTCLPSLLAALLVTQGVDPKDCTSLVEISNNRVFKDRKNLKIYLQVLHLIAHSSKFSKEDKQALCGCLTNNSEDIISYLYKLLGVFTLEGEERLTKHALEETQGNLNAILEESFKQHLPLKPIPDLSARILKHFGKARIPYYVCAYLGGVKTLPEEKQKQILPKLTECVEGILAETLHQTRYNLDQSAHLKTLFETRPLLLEKWKEGASIPFVPPEEASSSDFDIRTFLIQKLVQDKHFKGEEISDFIKFLQGEISKEQFLIHTEKQVSSQSFLQRACLELIEAPVEKRGEILESISKNLKDFPEEAEFQNDIQALIRSLDPKIYKEEGWILTDTDDPEDLFFSGTEIEGSCQRITGNPDLSKCLLAYVLDGKNRLLALKDNTGRIMARSIMRLLWDGTGPVLFLERLYPANAPSSWEQALENFAIQRGKALEVPLTSSEFGKGPDYPLSLSSLSSSAPYEYSDGGGGVTGGTFTISGAHLIA